MKKSIKLIVLLFTTFFFTKAQTPYMLKDVMVTNWSPSKRVLISNKWFFETDGNKLWVTDGTTNGTVLLKTFGGTGIYTFHELNGKLLLFADDNSNSTYELWTSDGTTAGTALVKDLIATSWNPSNRILINNQWFFETDNNDLWKTDGTTAGTILLKTFGGTGIYTFRELNNKLLFFANDNGNATYELWQSDATIAGTVLIKDILATNWNPTNSLLINNQWYFETDGNKLWNTDGTNSGTLLLKTFGGTNIYTFSKLNSKLLLLADDNNNATFELWSSDGTSAGTVSVIDLTAANWNPSNRILINNQWFFEMDGNKLWKTDGTNAGTVLLKTFGGTGLYTFHELNNKLLLFANDNGNATYELWTSDATVSGTVLVKDVLASSWNPTNRLLVNNKWFFEMDGNKLFVSDGTTAGTTVLKNFGGVGIYTFHQLNGKLLLFADDDSNSTFELWASDASVSGTVLIKDLLAANWNPTNRVLINNQWFFETDGLELWKTDGTTGGTTLLKTFSGAGLYTFHQINNQFLFFADDNANATYELWSVNVPLAVNQIADNEKQLVSFFPNPFSQTTTIQIASDKLFYKDNYVLNIFNASGKNVYRLDMSSFSETLNLNLASAIYFYHVYDDNNNMIGRGKLIAR